VSVTVNDGLADSNTATRGVAIVPATAPTLDQPLDVTVDEDSAASTIALTGIGAGVSGGVLSVAAQPVNAALFSAFTISYSDPAASGAIQFTPAPDAFGTTDVAITVTAGTGPAARTVTRVLRVTIAPINDRPTLAALTDRTLTAGVPQTVSLAGIGTGAANETQTLTVTAVSSNPSIVPNPVVTYSSPGTAGMLTLTAAGSGTATITVTVNDGQAANNTIVRTFTVTAAARLNTPPTISPIADISVIEGQALPAVSFTVGDAESAASALTVSAVSLNGTLVPSAALSLTGTDAARGLVAVNAPYKIGTARIVITVSDGELSSSTAFNAVVRPQWDYYLPDGWALPNVATDIRATNPHGANAPVRLLFLKPSGPPQEQLFDIPADSRWSARLSNVPAAAGGTGEVSTFIRSIDNLPLLVERTMIWDTDAHAGSAETALESTNMQWYFAEGAQGALRTSLIVANPNDEEVTVTVTFLLEGGAPVARSYAVGPLARRTIVFQDVRELIGRSFGMVVDATRPIAAERTTYLDAPRAAQAGLTSAGVPFPSTQWYFAEGSDWKIFQTFVLLMNPGSVPAKVRIDYHTMTGAHFTTTHDVGARARLTVDTLAAEPRLDGQHFWMQVSSDQPIAAERSMYWDRGAAGLSEGHNSHGVLEPSRHWSTGDARVGGPQQYSTFVLIGNPSSTRATLTVTIKRDAGADIVSTRQLEPFGRDTINVNTAVPALSNESFWLNIDSDVPIIAERSQYWSPEGTRGSWTGGTNAFALPVVPPDYNGCSYDVGPVQLTAPAPGARLQVHVGATSRCTYTATAAAAWVHVASGESGSGVSTVTLRVDPNVTTSARSAAVTIAGRTVTVAQDAAPAIAVGDPRMALETPRDGARVGSEFRLSGWAVDLGALDGTPGVSAIHVWAYPNPGSGSPPLFVGATTIGIDRPDVEQLYGERTLGSGYSLQVRGMQPGIYQLVVFAYSSVTHNFTQARAVQITVAPDPQMVIDLPGAGKITLPAMVAGWTLDHAADGGPGIDAVHVWAYPAAGGAPIFTGAADYGVARPDVAAAFGNPAFTNSGYGMILRGLAPGKYTLAVFAHRLGGTSFDVMKTVAIEIDEPPHQFMGVDALIDQPAGQSFTVSGWAVDLAAPSGTGVDTVHVWAFPPTGAPIFLGAATYGIVCANAENYLGARARNSGFSLAVSTLPAGQYRIVAFAHSTVSGQFDQSRANVMTITAR